MISGKEAKLAWAKGEDIEYNVMGEWGKLGGSTPLSIFERIDVGFRLKPRTISINGIEVPAPFEPKEGDRYLYLNNNSYYGFGCREYSEDDEDYKTQFGAWRTEEEIKQVVEALRNVFNP